MVRQSFEGTWEEITQHAAELAGRRVRLTVLEDADASSAQLPAPDTQTQQKILEAASSFPPGTTLAEAMKDYIGCVSSGKPHNDSRRVKKIWGEYVLEKHRKNQERRK